MEMNLSSESFMGQTLAVITGALLGVAMHQILSMANWDITIPVEEGEPAFSVSGRDIAVLGLGAVMIAFGGKISTYVKYAGVGMLAWQLGHEIKDFVWKSP